jgi:hypothetical protein
MFDRYPQQRPGVPEYDPFATPQAELGIIPVVPDSEPSRHELPQPPASYDDAYYDRLQERITRITH